MATETSSLRFALRPASDHGGSDGSWWPHGRELGDQLPNLFELWPPDAGRIVRVLYSPPDWDDRPRSVAVGAGRGVKTGSFPLDDTHRLTLSMLNGDRRTIDVIAPETPPGTAAGLLAGFATSQPSRT